MPLPPGRFVTLERRALISTSFMRATRHYGLPQLHRVCSSGTASIRAGRCTRKSWRANVARFRSRVTQRPTLNVPHGRLAAGRVVM
jgi:hypothetical protein